MTFFDFPPLFRSSVGFDSIPLLLDSATRVSDHADSYPPYNIQNTDENNYWISIVVAGFGEAGPEVAAREVC